MSARKCKPLSSTEILTNLALGKNLRTKQLLMVTITTQSPTLRLRVVSTTFIVPRVSFRVKRTKRNARDSMMLKRKIKGVILFLVWDYEKSFAARQVLNAFMERCNAVQWTFLEIDNSDPQQPFDQYEWERIAECRIGGDNSNKEFSGWDKGWSSVKSNLGRDFDIVILANDALLNSKPYEQIELIDNDLLQSLSRTNGAIGWVDSYAEVSPTAIDLDTTPMKIFGYPSRWWVCTTFVVFSVRLFDCIVPLASKDLGTVYVEQFEGNPFRMNSGLSKQYEKFLLEHQSKKWYKKYQLNAESFPLFREKTAMIINEQLIGIRIEQVSGKLIDLRVLAKPMRPRDARIQRLPFRWVRFHNLVRLTRLDLDTRIEKARAKYIAECNGSLR